jgi:nucleoside-diphosphate-sugar epimerase
MSRSVLITGGGGFVGAHLAQGLLALGHAVTALDQAFDVPTRERLPGATIIEAPLTSATLGQLEGAFDVVIHGAALTSSPEELGLSDVEHIRINIDLLLDCLGAVLAKRVPQFVFLSSSGVFASGDGEPAFSETTVPTGTFAYALAKRCGETLVLGAGGDRLSPLVVRLGPIYGPHETSRQSRLMPSPVRRWMDAANSGQPIVVDAAASRRDWTYAPDLAKAIDRLVDAEVTGVIHLTSAQIVSDLALAEMVASLVSASRIELSKPQGCLRHPMVSTRAELDGFAWTGLAAGLAQTFAQEAAV